jgi:hypothetical protein
MCGGKGGGRRTCALQPDRDPIPIRFRGLVNPTKPAKHQLISTKEVNAATAVATIHYKTKRRGLFSTLTPPSKKKLPFPEEYHGKIRLIFNQIVDQAIRLYVAIG